MRRITYTIALGDFPHTFGQAGVVLALALGHTRSASIAAFAGSALRSAQKTLGQMVAMGLVEHRECFGQTGRKSRWIAVRPDLWRWVVLVPAIEILVRRGFDVEKLSAIRQEAVSKEAVSIQHSAG